MGGRYAERAWGEHWYDGLIYMYTIRAMDYRPHQG